MEAQRAPLTIWTIGHSTRTIEELLELLAENGIEIVADVRRFPGSRRYPQFNQAEFAGALDRHGVGYEHFGELGGRRAARADSRNLAWRNAAFRGYADYMDTKAYRDGIARLMKLAANHRVAVMCSEAVWWRCHRSMIADDLKSKGVRVVHILGPEKTQEHPYTAAAAIVDGRLSYAGAPLFAVSETKEKKAVLKHFKVGDHVTWNSEAGYVSGIIKKKITSEIEFKGYKVHASKDEPQYLIKSDKTDHLAMHKGTALTKSRKAAAG
jgi:hypothetical protein